MTSKRDINPINETAFLQKDIKPVLFARLDFLGGVQRFHTEIGPKNATHPVHGSELYLGVGDFGGIEGQVTESIAGAPQALRLLLSGVNPTLVNDMLTDQYHRRSAEVMVGLENELGVLVANPEILFSGFMDKPDLSLDANTGSIAMSCESRGTNLKSASDVRFSDEDKQAEVSGDLFAEYAYRMQDITLRWGDRNFRSPLGVPGPTREDERRGRGRRGDLP